MYALTMTKAQIDGTKTYHKCISLLRELRSNSEQV